MTEDEFLNELRKARSALFTIKMSDFIDRQDDATKASFRSLMLRLTQLIMDIEDRQLRAIADRLTANEAGFKAAIEDLKKVISNLKNAVQVINTISRIISIAERVVGLLA